MNHEQYNM